MNAPKPGLLLKYFVLNPSKSDAFGCASRAAMRTYARFIEKENPALAADLREWVDRESVRLLGSAEPEPEPS